MIEYLPRSFIVALAALAVAGAGVVGHLFVDYLTADWEWHDGTVIQTFYEAPRTGSGVGIGSGGNTTVVVTSTSATYNALLEFRDGSRVLVPIDERTLLHLTPGSSFHLQCLRGGLTKEIHRCRV